MRIRRVPHERGEVSLGKVGLSSAHSKYVFLHKNGSIVMILRHHLISYWGSQRGIGNSNIAEGAELEDTVWLPYIIICNLVGILKFGNQYGFGDAGLWPWCIPLVICNHVHCSFIFGYLLVRGRSEIWILQKLSGPVFWCQAICCSNGVISSAKGLSYLWLSVLSLFDGARLLTLLNWLRLSVHIRLVWLVIF